LIVFLSGCANGIGRHMARVFYEQGHSVVVTDIDAAGLASLTSGWETTRCLSTSMDVRRPDDWQRVITETLSRWGRIDVGLNIAGIVRPGYVAEFPLADVELMVDVNLKGVLLGTRLLSEQMVRQGSGHLINIASLAGTAPIQGLSVYSATKFGVRGFTLAAAGELRKHGVRVSCICPDLVDTNMVTDQIDHPAAALSFSGGRLLTVHDIERAILYDALQRNKLEILIPNSRGWIGKIGNLFPALGFSITDLLTQKGLKQQAAMREKRKN
jgi:3-oxoacyl-[acyl-carrier protein] reductase